MCLPLTGTQRKGPRVWPLWVIRTDTIASGCHHGEPLLGDSEDGRERGRIFTYCSSSCLSLRCFPSAPHRSFHYPFLLLRTFFPQMLQGGARSLSALPGTSSGRLPWSRPGLPPSFPVLLFGTAVITAQISYVFKRLPPHQVLSSTQEGLCVRSAHCCVLNNKHYLAYSRCSNVCWREVKEEIKRK